MIGELFSWFKRMGWITIIILIIAPAAAGLIVATVFHDLGSFFHTLSHHGVHLPHLPKLKK